MFAKIKSLLRVTAVRLSIAYSIAFVLLAVIVVFYMTGGAVNYLRQQVEGAINTEVATLGQIYRTGGINELIYEMEQRSSVPGAKLYVVADQSGRIIAGNIKDLEDNILERVGWIHRPFEYEGFQTSEHKHEELHAVARVFKLPNGLRILVGQDIGQPERLKSIVARALWLAMAIMALASFIIWFFVGRSALKRIDLVSKSTERILAGDRTERLPVTGSKDEFDRLSVRMNAMLDRIALLDDGLRSVSDSIAHDLKTPLTRLRNKVDSALANNETLEQSQETLAEVISDSDQLIKTFNALLMISRVESGSQVAALAKLNMTALMEDVSELYEPVAEDENISIICDFDKNVEVNGNRELLSQAITNLIDNALKYGASKDKRKKSIITMRLTKNKKHVVASITDNGEGVAAVDFEEIKKRFKRLDASRSKPGNGLGLSLVEAIAKLHNGSLEFGDAKPGFIAELILPNID